MRGSHLRQHGFHLAATAAATYGLLTDVQFRNLGLCRVAVVKIPEVGTLRFIGIAGSWYCVEELARGVRDLLVKMGLLEDEE